MNRAARQPYHALCRQVEREAAVVLEEGRTVSLCHICRYADWSHDEPQCMHPIDRLAQDGEHCYDVWGGSDCWGFRPRGTPAEVLAHLRETVEWQREMQEDARDPGAGGGAMNAPYYHDAAAGITLHLGRAEDVLPTLETQALVLVTDPPYGVGFTGKATKHTSGNSGGYTTTDDALVGPAVVALALTLVKRGAVFPGVRNLFAYPEAQDIGGVYCPSGAGMGSWGFRCFHPVLFYGKRPGAGMRPSSIESFDTAPSNGHPCPKPMRWMRWLVALCCLPGETVLDPFCGSGTSLLAAKSLGHRAIGIEIEERYAEIAARRLSQGVLLLEEASG